MPTTVDKTIGTGGGYDYSTLAAWESGTQGNLVSADEIRRGVISQAAYAETLSGAFEIAGSTADATRYRVLTVAPGCSAFENAANPLRYDESKGAAIRGGTTSYTSWFTLNEDYCLVELIQLIVQNSRGFAISTATAKLRRSLSWASGTSGGAVALDNIFGKAENCAIIQSSNLYAADLRTGGVLLNCTFAVPTSVTYSAQLIFHATYQTGTIANCALFAGGQAAHSSDFTYSNCYTDRSSPPSGCTNVAYDTSTGSGFEAIGSTHDYRIKSTSALKDTGTATGAPSLDIFGQTRSTIDVGCFEFLAAAGFKSAWARNSNSIVGLGAAR